MSLSYLVCFLTAVETTTHLLIYLTHLIRLLHVHLAITPTLIAQQLLPRLSSHVVALGHRILCKVNPLHIYWDPSKPLQVLRSVSSIWVRFHFDRLANFG